jgi:predicted  nucleic acid-binding Zn-ribbon protein
MRFSPRMSRKVGMLCGFCTSLYGRMIMSFWDIFKIDKIKEENERLNIRVSYLEKQLADLGFTEHEQAKKALDSMNQEIADADITINKLKTQIATLNEDSEKAEKKLSSVIKKLNRSKEIYNSIDHAINNFLEYTPELSTCKIDSSSVEDLDNLTPSIILKLHCMDMRDLRKAYNENDKQISDLLSKYDSRYTTKSNKAIYQLMVIALRAELQNILYNLKFEKLDKSIDDLKKVTAKYLAIAAEGNQSIAGTMTKFIGEIEYLFINAIKIEYNYYVKKEQAKQEQIAIREQMRQEAEERKALEAEQKKIAAEESKYESEIEKIKEKMLAAAEDEKKLMEARILELQAQLADVVIKKENIINLQNGKAGNIYIISNLGAFGDSMFKIGMTRRINPQDRVDELGDASVPFKFDVHSFIFSDNAVDLETSLHNRLSSKRVNKVNMRKEFFYSTIEELEALVAEIAPTAEFTKTMLAEEFRQSQSSQEIYSTNFVLDEDEE